MSRQTPDKGAGAYVRLTAAERRELTDRARRAQRTLSGEIRLAIARHLDEKEPTPADRSAA